MVAKKVEHRQNHPHQVSYEEYLNLAGDSHIVEWVKGEIITTMPPLDTHQDINRFLSVLLDVFIELFKLGKLRYAPFEVKLWPDGPSREPDIFFVAADHADKLTPKRFEGAPDLIVEIISPSSVTEDRVRKFDEYQQAGVREYWIIDPRVHQTQADFYVLDEAGEYQTAPVDDAGLYHATVLPGFWLKLDWLWQNPLPDSQRVLAEIVMTMENISPELQDVYRRLYEVLKDRG